MATLETLRFYSKKVADRARGIPGMAEKDFKNPFQEAMEEIYHTPASAHVPLLSRFCDHEEHKECKGYYEKLREKSGAIVSANCICDCHKTVIHHVVTGPAVPGRKYEFLDQFGPSNPIDHKTLIMLIQMLGLHVVDVRVDRMMYGPPVTMRTSTVVDRITIQAETLA
jgi:hypothetical protein